MKKSNKIILGTMILAILGLAVYKIFFSGSNQKIEIETIKIRKGLISNAITATGTINPTNVVNVGTQVSGEIKKVYVDFNSKVTKGQLIAELDTENLQNAVKEALASYNASVAEKEYQTKNYNRVVNMANAGVVSTAEKEQALYSYQSAQQSLIQKGSALEKARKNLQYAYVYSPIDGVILDKQIEEGQTVASSMNTPTLFSIAQSLTEMQVDAKIDEADIGNIKEGQNVSFTVDAYPGEEFDGVVKQARLNPTTESNVVTYTVVITAHNDELKLKPGLTATTTIYTKELKDILLLPAKAVNFTADAKDIKAYYKQKGIDAKTPKEVEKDTDKTIKNILTKKSNGELQNNKVQIGDSDGINYQIISGLKEGDEAVYDLQVQTGKKKEIATGGLFQKPSPKGKSKGTTSIRM